MKRLLFTLHRWLGIVLGLFMLLWFASGIAMLYAGPSMLPAQQRLAHAPDLHAEAGWLSLGEAWVASAGERAAEPAKGHQHHDHAKQGGRSRRPAGEARIGEARLVSQAGEPVWLVEDDRGGRHAISALDGRLRGTAPERAVAIAREWSGGAAHYVETFDSDRGTRMSHFDIYRPFHRVALNDAAGTELLISARTGEVVRAASATDRALRLVGGWLHFFRPLDELGLGAVRKDVLTWTALVGTVAALTGLVVGWLRMRPGWFGAKRYSGGRVHPYHAAWPRWHFWLGLTGGLFALAWIASGFLSTNPWALFSRAQASPEELSAYRDGAPPAALLAVRPAQWLAAAPTPVELSLHHVGSDAVALAHGRDGTRHAVGPAQGFAEATLVEAARRVVPGGKLRAQRWLTDYDSYYYPTQRQSPAERPLPVLEVELDDAAGTRLYLDPADGELVARLDRSRRVYRWVFHALHSWDFGWLRTRPAWDVWMIGWSLAGLALSATSLVIAWRRLTRSLPQPRRTARGAINLNETEEACAS